MESGMRTEWVPPLGYVDTAADKQDIDQYLFGYYNWHRPHQANVVLAPAKAEEKLKLVSGFC